MAGTPDRSALQLKRASRSLRVLNLFVKPAVLAMRLDIISPGSPNVSRTSATR
jgi:hypothetical protein